MYGDGVLFVSYLVTGTRTPLIVNPSCVIELYPLVSNHWCVINLYPPGIQTPGVLSSCPPGCQCKLCDLRRVAWDGFSYTVQEFMDYYGDAWAIAWTNAI